MKKLFLIFAAIILSGCAITAEERAARIEADKATLAAYNALNQARIQMVSDGFASCRSEAEKDIQKCESDLCRVDIVRSAENCQSRIIDAAGKVAAELPQQRAGLGTVALQELGATVRAALPQVGTAYVTGEFIDGVTSIVNRTGRPNIDNRVTYTDAFNTQEQNGNTDTQTGDGSVVGSGSIVQNDTQTTVDGQGRINSDGHNAGVDLCTAPNCQQTGSQNPVDTTHDPAIVVPQNCVIVPTANGNFRVDCD